MSLVQQHATAAIRYDETLHADGTVRPGWQSLLTYVEGLSLEQRQQREQSIIHQMRANGLAYDPENLLADSGRPWNLDLVPMLFDQTSWDDLSKGLNQRARLKQLLYRDIYGEQTLLKTGVIPPSMLYSHHSYLRDLVDADALKPNTEVLPMYSCDVSRSPSGSWLVVDDVCQYPAGIGYALENRVVLSRVLHGAFKKYRVRRIATYFRQLQKQIQGSDSVAGRCVLLSYPPNHPHYFEFAWLAKYLGYPLIETADLTVRDDHVFIKTITGLQVVDVILRLIDDDEIDPLILGNKSNHGVPGIVEVARRGGVRILNPMGAGVLDNPAFNAVLGDICTALLGEPLMLESPPTYWLGNNDQLQHVMANVDQLLFRHVDSLSELNDPLLMTAEAKQQLIDQIKLTPSVYVAQERIDRSVAPGLINAEFVQQQITIRTFHIATEQTEGNDHYESMPGGLCLLDNISGGSRPAIERLNGSKDVWILSDQEVIEDTLLSAHIDATYFEPHDGALPSRVAENVFWLGRNSERVECTLRLLRNILQQLLDEDRSLDQSLASLSMQCLLRSLTIATSTTPGFTGKGGAKKLAQPGAELISLLQEIRRYGTLANSLQLWQNSASSVSDRLSSDQLRIFTRLSDLQASLSQLQLDESICTDKSLLSKTIQLLDELLITTLAGIGLEHENVTHTDVWQFAMLGRRIERAHQISATVNTVMSCERENQRVLESLLRLFDSVMTYRSRYRSGLDNRLVLQLLLLDEVNPRSLAYQFKCIQELLDQIPGRRTSGNLDPMNRLAVAGLSRVRLADPRELLNEDNNARQNLNRFLEELQQLPASMADAITAQYFTHTEKRQDVGNFHSAATETTETTNNSHQESKA